MLGNPEPNPYRNKRIPSTLLMRLSRPAAASLVEFPAGSLTSLSTQCASGDCPTATSWDRRLLGRLSGGCGMERERSSPRMPATSPCTGKVLPLGGILAVMVL